MGRLRKKEAVFVAMSVVLFLAAMPLMFSVNMLERDLLLGDPALEILSTQHRLLASKQSNGFFDDITDGSWMLMQQRARSYVQQSDENNLQVSTWMPYTVW